MKISEIGSICVTTTRPFGSVGVDDVADVDLSYAGDAVDRRGQPRIAELRPSPLDQRLVGLDGRLQLRHLRLLGFDQLRSGPALLPQWV